MFFDVFKNKERKISKNKGFYKMSANNDKATEISSKEFENTISNSKYKAVVVDFFAEWCMPCVMMAPVLEELASEFKQVKFAKINVDENKKLSEKFNIMSIPCLIVFKNGKEVERIIGSHSAVILEEKLKKYLK